MDLLAGLIAEVDSARAGDEFYDHVCEALCRLTSLERAALVLYDPASRAVRPAGCFGADRALVAQIEGTLDETPMAQRALAEDRVVWASDQLERELPPRYARFAGITTILCAPIAAGGRWFGVMFADRGGGRFEPSAEELQTTLTLGRLAALAAGVERATRQGERARRLSERILLVREIHERAMQRLFGVTLALGSGEALSASDRQACHDELQAALADLRLALDRAVDAAPPPSGRPLRELVARRAERTPQLGVRWDAGVDVPARLEPVAQAVFVEALRNCEKHADAARIDVSIRQHGDAFELEIASDGARPAARGPGSGLGLRLLTLEALQHDALVEYGPLEGGRWHVRLVGPAR